jgi:hypothetical protein
MAFDLQPVGAKLLLQNAVSSFNVTNALMALHRRGLHLHGKW